MEQLESQLTGAEVTLSTDVLNSVNETAAPGITVNLDDNNYGATKL